MTLSLLPLTNGRCRWCPFFSRPQKKIKASSFFLLTVHPILDHSAVLDSPCSGKTVGVRGIDLGEHSREKCKLFLRLSRCASRPRADGRVDRLPAPEVEIMTMFTRLADRFRTPDGGAWTGTLVSRPKRSRVKLGGWGR